jgi:hypothetical protein
MEVESTRFNSLTADVLGGHCGRPGPAIDIGGIPGPPGGPGGGPLIPGPGP